MSFFMPKAPPPPPPPPPVPTRSDAETKFAEEQERARLRRKLGRQSTVLTAGFGVLGDPSTTSFGKQTLGA